MAHAATMDQPRDQGRDRSSAGTAEGSAGKLPNWALLGLLFGLVGAVSILLWGPIGVSGTYPRVIGALFRLLDGGYAEANPYLVKMGALMKTETWLVLGLPIGGFLASRLGKAPKAPACEMVHAMERTTGTRYRDAFLGGFLIVFGARLAGGCTSGHIISGIMQLSISGLIFGAAVFATGIATAKLIRKGA
jgi:uncharacterized membrane protein YedE/YeeE